MSYIDTFDHELVGFFGGLPLYHPLEVVSGTSVPGEFACSPSQLVLGGGDGEHPAIILHDAAGAVTIFVGLWFEAGNKQDDLSTEALAILDQAPTPTRCLKYADWELEKYASFFARCLSPAFPTPYRIERHMSMEGWFVASLGEFIYFSMPELATETVKLLHEADVRIHEPLFFNVTVPPPGSLRSGQANGGEARSAHREKYRW